MLNKLSLVFALLAAPAFSAGIEIDVTGEAKGLIKIDLFEDIAPNHVDRITTLARDGAYDGVVFHRVIDGFMAQTGDVQYGKVEGDVANAGYGSSSMDDLKAEFSSIKFEEGIVGMARGQTVDSANSQFFIMLAPYPPLNGQYTVVGKVTEGFDVVKKIKLGLGRNGAVLGEMDWMVSVTVTD